MPQTLLQSLRLSRGLAWVPALLPALVLVLVLVLVLELELVVVVVVLLLLLVQAVAWPHSPQTAQEPPRAQEVVLRWR